MKLERAKGTKDYPPEEKIRKQKVIDTLRGVFELYGFNPLETPLLERQDVLASKYAGGAEILKEMFTLSDQGERELGLRYDLTVPFCRFIGMNPTMKMPFKRYQAGRVFRDGPIKKGRLREFWQCDVDVVGSKSMLSDAEVVILVDRCFKELGLEVYVEVNNRKLLNGMLRSLGVNDEKLIDVILTIDKLKKISREDILKEFSSKGVKEGEKLLDIFSLTGSNADKLNQLKEIITDDEGKEGLQEVEEMLGYVESSLGSDSSVLLTISLARGLAYYTGTVFEVYMKDGVFRSSLAGGGRYDKLIGAYLGGGREFPAVGISFGIAPIGEMLKEKEDEIRKSISEVYVIPIKTTQECVSIAEELRDAGLRVDMDVQGRGISKNLDYANAYGIPYVVFAGQQELDSGKVKLKDMISGKEELLSVKDVVEKLRK